METSAVEHDNPELLKLGFKWYESAQQWLNMSEMSKMGLSLRSGGEIMVTDLAAWDRYQKGLYIKKEVAITRKADEAAKDASLFQQAVKQESSPIQQRLT